MNEFVKIEKLLKHLVRHYDSKYYYARDINGNIYDGMTFVEVFESSHFFREYMDVYEYFDFNADFGYNPDGKLNKLVFELELDMKVRFIEAVYNLFFFNSSYQDEGVRLANIIAKYDIQFDSDLHYKKVTISKFPKKSGSYCDVYFIDKDLVKKQLKREYLEDAGIRSRFKNEFRIMLDLCDKYDFLKVMEYNPIESSFIMERADSNLWEFMRVNILSEEQKLDFVDQLLAKMEKLQTEGILHRDLHLGNILLKNDCLHIVDFGLGKSDKHIRSMLTISNEQLNYNHFIAPEVKLGIKNSSNYSEVFSFGCLVDYIMTNGDESMPHLYKDITRRATEKIKENRYESIREVQIAIEKLKNYSADLTTISEIESKIASGFCDELVEKHVTELVAQGILAAKIVSNMWWNFHKLFTGLSQLNQLSVSIHLRDNYVKATGYNGWGNYSLFGRIAFEILKSKNVTLESKEVIADVFEGCRGTRFDINDLVEHIMTDDSIPSSVKKLIEGGH